MNPDRLLAHFDRISEAPDAVPRLRRFILDLAVRGKLVEQDPNDEPAAELLKRIQAEMARLVKEGEIRKSSPLPTVSANDAPFPLPVNWQWARFGELIEDADSGWSPKTEGFPRSGDNWGVLKVSAVSWGRFLPDENKQLLPNVIPPKSAAVHRGDFLISRANTSELVAKCVVVEDEPKMLILSDKIVRLQLAGECAKRFLCIANNSAEYARAYYAEQASGTSLSMKNVSRPVIYALAIPLPPLAEQHRIVAKVDELMALCDRLEAAQADRESRRDRLAAASLHRLNNGADVESFREHARFHLHHLPRLTTRPVHIHQLRQTILNLAVRGHLTSQDPNDEPAEVILKRIHQARARLYAEKRIPKPKDLPRIEDLDIPFVIPVGWHWAMLGMLCYQVSDGPHFSPSYVSRDEGVPFLSTRNVRLGGFDLSDLKYVSKEDHEEYCKRIRPENGDILYTKGGTTGIARVNDLNFEFSVWVHLAVLRVAKEFLMPRYIELALNSPLCYEQSQAYTQGISNYDLGLTRMIKIVMPLPPLTEQHRIVAKVDQLMALCNQMEAGLTTTATTAHCILEATLHRAFAVLH